MLRIPMLTPSGEVIFSRNFITSSKLSSGSPIPISTILEMGRPESSWEKSTWSRSSDGSSLRTRPPIVDAQNLQPIGQPTSDEMQTVLPW